MSDKTQNSELPQESVKESDVAEKSTVVAQDSPKEANNANGTEKLQGDFEALKGVVSGKDKKLKETQDALVELQQNLLKTQNQLKVKDMLIDSDLPEPVKAVLKGEIEDLTPENFEIKAEKYKAVFEGGKKSYEQDVIKSVEKKPADTKDAADLALKIENAKSEQELYAILEGR